MWFSLLQVHSVVKMSSDVVDKWYLKTKRIYLHTSCLFIPLNSTIVLGFAELSIMIADLVFCLCKVPDCAIP